MPDTLRDPSHTLAQRAGVSGCASCAATGVALAFPCARPGYGPPLTPAAVLCESAASWASWASDAWDRLDQPIPPQVAWWMSPANELAARCAARAAVRCAWAADALAALPAASVAPCSLS